MAASVWMRSCNSPTCVGTVRPSALTIPVVTVWLRPNGLPTAIVMSPTTDRALPVYRRGLARVFAGDEADGLRSRLTANVGRYARVPSFVALFGYNGAVVGNADLVKAINGLDMATPDKALEAYTKLKSASHLTVQLERRGENITLDYQIR